MGTSARMSSAVLATARLLHRPHDERRHPPLRARRRGDLRGIFDRAWHVGPSLCAAPDRPRRVPRQHPQRDDVSSPKTTGQGVVGFVSVYEPASFVHNLYVEPGGAGRRHRQGAACERAGADRRQGLAQVPVAQSAGARLLPPSRLDAGRGRRDASSAPGCACTAPERNVTRRASRLTLPAVAWSSASSGAPPCRSKSWLAFTAASTVLLLIPGPTVLLVVSYALGQGWRTALPMAVGVALGDFTAMTLSMLGVGALLAASRDRLHGAEMDRRGLSGLARHQAVAGGRRARRQAAHRRRLCSEDARAMPGWSRR